MTRELKRSAGAWVLYILECRDGTFYTGITNDMQRRLHQHNAGSAARYTRGRGPVTLRYHEACSGRSQALVREAAVKRLARRAKQRLINSTE
jgi:predicted GIY-YIG superfamily endonuclease